MAIHRFKHMARVGTNSMTDRGTAGPADVPQEYGYLLGNPEEYFTTIGIDYTCNGARRMPFDLNRMRVVQNGMYSQPVFNRGGQQNKAPLGDPNFNPKTFNP